MPDSSPSSGPSTDTPRKPSRAGRWKRRLGWSFLTLGGGATLLLVAWFAFGLPLKPFLGFARGPLEEMGVELALEEGNLRPTFSDGLILQIEGVRVGDLERADRLDVSSVVISWSWKELFTLHLPPQSIEVGKLLLRPSLDENGALVVVALRPSPERAEPADSKPLQWPLSELFLPSDGATCLYDFGQIEVELPNGFEYGGGAAAALDDLQWTFSRTGETVTLVGGARVRHSEVPLLRLKNGAHAELCDWFIDRRSFFRSGPRRSDQTAFAANTAAAGESGFIGKPIHL